MSDAIADMKARRGIGTAFDQLINERKINDAIESGRFTRDDRASIAHALMHLETNKIADDDYQGHSGWYCGNREQFVRRHKKAVALMRALLKQNASNEGRKPAPERTA